MTTAKNSSTESDIGNDKTEQGSAPALNQADIDAATIKSPTITLYPPQADKPKVIVAPSGGFSIADFDTKSVSENGVEIQLRHIDGREIPVFLQVLGEHSEVVQKYLINQAHKKGMAIMAANKASKMFNDAEWASSVIVPSAVARVTGWKGINEPCTPENVAKLFAVNRDFAYQVLNASADTERFTKALPEA